MCRGDLYEETPNYGGREELEWASPFPFCPVNRECEIPDEKNKLLNVNNLHVLNMLAIYND